MPDRFAVPVEENIDQEEQLINTLPVTNGMCALIRYLREWIQSAGQPVKDLHFSQKFH